jgi:hypothetical protein
VTADLTDLRSFFNFAQIIHLSSLNNTWATEDINMPEAGYCSLTTLVNLEDEFEAILYNRLNGAVKHRYVKIVHLISIPRDFVFSVNTGPEYLRIKTSWFMVDDSYSRKNSLLHVMLDASAKV